MATNTTTTVQEEEQHGPTFDYAKAMDEYKVGQKPILDAIMSNYKKPEPEIDPEQARKAKFGAALTDTFGSLAEMFAHGQGALVSKRDGASSTQTTNAKLQALKDKYDKDMLQYGAVKSNAELQDLNMYLSSARDEAGKKRQYALYKSKAAEEAEKEAERVRQFDVKAKEAARHNKAMENKPTGSQRTTAGSKTLPVYVNNRQHDFPVDLVDEVVARAVKDGVAGKVKVGDDPMKKAIMEEVKPTTKLTAQQKQAIFQSVYPRYLQEGDNGKLLIRRGLSAYDKKSGVTAQEKWKMPKQAAQPKKQTNNDPLGIL